MPPTDSNSFFGIKVSKFGTAVNQATDNDLIYKDDFSTKTYFDATTARILEGLLPDGSYGMWVSTPGVDVRTANPDTTGQLIFNSNQDIFKIVAKITTPVSFTSSGSNQLTTYLVNHGQSYTPLIAAYIENFTIQSYITNPITVPLPYAQYGTTSGVTTFVPVNFVVIASVTSTQVLYQVGTISTGLAVSGTLVTYILQETVG